MLMKRGCMAPNVMTDDIFFKMHYDTQEDGGSWHH